MPPNQLTIFFARNSRASWDDFRYNSKQDFYALRDLIFADQGQLCAYCEKSLKNNALRKKRIEHFHSKSDKSDPNVNWALDWSNVIGVCLGGSYNDKNQLDSEFRKYPPPHNLSCDAFKGHFEEKNKYLRQCEGYTLNPLDMIASPTLFGFEKATGKLTVNEKGCTLYQPKYNNFSSVAELVNNTILVFNLNCDRLIAERLQIFYEYQRQIKSARRRNDKQIHSKLVQQWFGEQWPSFFTTRRILLATHVEKFLANKAYDG